jgi:hypothetical protein
VAAPSPVRPVERRPRGHDGGSLDGCEDMIQPLLRCGCGRIYAETEARRLTKGRRRGHLIGPCRHLLTQAVYIDPVTRRVLVPYAA